MKRKKIVCISCGKAADIVQKGSVAIVSCSVCNSEVEMAAYQRKIDALVDERRKGAYARKVMGKEKQV